jgi:hypothetical protein
MSTNRAGFWTCQDGQMMRDKFVEIIRNKGLDPLLVESWYSLRHSDIRQNKGESMVAHFEGSYQRAAVSLFPELNLDISKFHANKNWSTHEKQRSFFDNYAKSREFDPLIPANWYSITINDVIQAGGRGLLDRYQGSYITALTTLYPNIGLQKGMFFGASKMYKSVKQQRDFFDSYAKFNNFDPLVAENWYNITRKHVLAAGGAAVLSHYKGSQIKALKAVYPNLWEEKR